MICLHTNSWCDNTDGRTWNARRAEREVLRIRRLLDLLERMGSDAAARDILSRQMFRSPDQYSRACAAAEEMRTILTYGKDNPSSICIHRARTDRNIFCLYAADADVEDQPGTAEDRMEHVPYLYSEKTVLTAGSAKERLMQAAQHGRHYIGHFNTEEEARLEASGHKDCTVVKMPAGEWFALCDERTGAPACNVLFSTETMALTFLYKAVMPPAWSAYLETCDAMNMEV